MKDLDKKFENLPKDKFVFANADKNIHDKELVTKPISYFRDAWNRFKRNKGSIFAAIVILILVAYALVAPLISNYSVAEKDVYYRYALPKSQITSDLGWDIWDGCKEMKNVGEKDFLLEYSKGIETGHNAIKNQEFTSKTVEETDKKGKVTEKKVFSYRLDTYQSPGVIFKQMTQEEFIALQKYQDNHNVQIIYPTTDPKLRPISRNVQNNLGNFWFKTESTETSYTIYADYDEDGNPVFENIYKKYSGGKDLYTSKMRIEGDIPLYDYAELLQNDDVFNVRVNYYEYYKYYHKEIKKDGITEPIFLFGANAQGQDLFICLASGARFSFIFAIIVATVNLLIGAIYGAIEGYYGGKIDLIMERIVEILSAVPFMIVITLLKYHLDNSQVVILFIAFFLTGWIGMAGRTRMQFYRYKNQEYVLAARTLGAKDLRIMFKHIFPNSLGTLITGCVLIIPSMIFSETSLSYLGIINLNTGSRTSVGTLLANGKGYLTTYPHIVIPPAIFISLLMLSFNLFGNGLRDAFNPSLRGSED